MENSRYLECEENYLVSVIVPVYNVERYLKKCLCSIVDQDYSNIEILIINDGSTDTSGEICDSIAAQDERISVWYQENAGVSVARNKGIEIAAGQCICFIDSDDFIEPDYISTMVHCMRENECDVVCCEVCFETDESHTQLKKETEESRISLVFNRQESVKKLFSHETFRGWPVNKLYRLGLIKEYNIRFRENLHICEDEVFVLEYLLKCTKVVFINDFLYHYMANPYSVNRKMVTERTFDYGYLNRLKADDICAEMIAEMRIQSIVFTHRARLFISSEIIMKKFILHYNGDKRTYRKIKKLLRKFLGYYLFSKNHKTGFRTKVGKVLFTTSPLWTNALKRVLLKAQRG